LALTGAQLARGEYYVARSRRDPCEALALRPVPKQSRCAMAATPRREVLHVDDLAVTDAEALPPVVALATGVRPGEARGYAIAAGVDVV